MKSLLFFSFIIIGLNFLYSQDSFYFKVIKETDVFDSVEKSKPLSKLVISEKIYKVSEKKDGWFKFGEQTLKDEKISMAIFSTPILIKIRKEPNLKSSVLETLWPGDTANFIEKKGEWIKITSSDITGWILAKNTYYSPVPYWIRSDSVRILTHKKMLEQKSLCDKGMNLLSEKWESEKRNSHKKKIAENNKNKLLNEKNNEKRIKKLIEKARGKTLVVKGLFIGMGYDDAIFLLRKMYGIKHWDGYNTRYWIVAKDKNNKVSKFKFFPAMTNRMFNVKDMSGDEFSKAFVKGYNLPVLQPGIKGTTLEWYYSDPRGFKVTITEHKEVIVQAVNRSFD